MNDENNTQKISWKIIRENMKGLISNMGLILVIITLPITIIPILLYATITDYRVV